MELGFDERKYLYGLIRQCRENEKRHRQVQKSLYELFQWAMGEGPLPVDEEAERAAWGYLRAIAIDRGYGALRPYLQLLLPRRDDIATVRTAAMLGGVVTKGPSIGASGLGQLLTTRCPDDFEVPTMPWSEALRRLREAAELRVAMGRIKEAMRRAAGGNRIGTIRALRGAVDAFGEAKASDPVELQWRIAELETEIREMERRKVELAG